MLWRGREGSGNVEDRRGMSGGGMAVGGGIGAIIIGILYFLLGGDPSQMPQLSPGQGQSSEYSAQQKAADDSMAQFVSVVLKYTENVWGDLLSGYQKPRLVIFRDGVQTACGGANAAVGPFYCPGDQKVYIDLSFFRDLKNRFGAPGDFAMAYVIAHEVGHHVQNLLGTSEKVRSLQQRSGEREGNKMSVKLELQADFYAGVWAHHAQRLMRILEQGDIEEALNAANAIGDDRLQQETRGRVVPDAFTHGTSAQRIYWFKKGFETGGCIEPQTHT